MGPALGVSTFNLLVRVGGLPGSGLGPSVTRLVPVSSLGGLDSTFDLLDILVLGWGESAKHSSLSDVLRLVFIKD